MLTCDALRDAPRPWRDRRQLDPLRYVLFARASRLAELDDGPRLRALYHATLARNLVRLDRCAALLDAAAANGIALLPVKGALLAETLYPDPGTRPFGDLDLVVRPRDLDGTLAMMQSLGFRRSFASRARFTPRHGHDVCLSDGMTVVELHYRLMHELGVDADVEPLFARAQPVLLFGRVRPVPSWDDQLWHVAVHAAAHSFGEHATWPVDLALLCARGASVEAASREAARRRASTAFSTAMALAHEVLPTCVPAPVAWPHRRLAMLRTVLGEAPLARRATPVRSLAARALVTDRPVDAARWLVRKVGLRAEELRERAT